jgi:hypothetical protein
MRSNLTYKKNTMNKPYQIEEYKSKLCYIKDSFAYFTTQSLSEQWGDDWDDAPYEHNAGDPYYYDEHDRKEGLEPWEIYKVAWDGNFFLPCDYVLNSRWSVRDINSGAIAWLQSEPYSKNPIAIPAGTTLDKFCELIDYGDGAVYFS